MAAESLRKLYFDWLVQDRTEHNGTNSVAAERYLSTMQVQGIIRQPDIYAVTKKTSNDEQNQELFIKILPTYGDFALKKFIKMLKATEGKLGEKLEELDKVRKEALKAAEPPPVAVDLTLLQSKSVEEEVKQPPPPPVFNPPSGVLSNLVVEKVADPASEKKKCEAQKDKIYANFSKPPLGHKGLALVVSNDKFNVPWLSARHGTETDVINLTTLLTALGYKVDVHRNLVAEAMTLLMQYFALDERQAESDSTVVVFLTHGLPNGILYGVDGEVLFVEDIVACLNSPKVKNLTGKPKIFIVEALRPFVSSDSEKKNLAIFEENNSYSNIPWKSDVIIGYPRTPGNANKQDVENGTWFVQNVCEVFAKHAHKMSIVELFSEVRKRLEEQKLADGSLLTAEVRDCSKKQFYFFPGM